MTQRKTVNNITIDELTGIVKQAVDESITKRLMNLEQRIDDNEMLLTGDGHPEDGLVLKVNQLIIDVEAIKKQMNRAVNALWTLACAIALYTVFQVIKLIITHGLTP